MAEVIGRLTRETLTGPWAGLPVAWTETDAFDEETFRGDVARCCKAGIPGVYSGGTTGEFYAMEFDEFRAVTRAMVEECHAHGKPAMVGCSSTYTLGVARRAGFAAEVGADAIQVALPFWMEVDDRRIVGFFEEVDRASGGLALSIYDTGRSKKLLTVDQHRAIKEAVAGYVMVKSTIGSVGATTEGCAALSKFVNVFVGESLWARLGPTGIRGCCSAMVYWNPGVILALWEEVEKKNWQQVAAVCERLERLCAFLHSHFGAKGFTDTAYDRLGGVASGFLKTSLRNRGPYVCATQADVDALRAWYGENFAEMLTL